MILSSKGVRLMLLCRGVCHVYHVHCFYFGAKLLLTPGILLVSLFVVAITGWPPPFVFGVELASLLEDPTTYVGMISWFVRVAVNLAGPIQYPV